MKLHLEYCPMQKDINKLDSAWLRAGEHDIQGEVEGSG